MNNLQGGSDSSLLIVPRSASGELYASEPPTKAFALTDGSGNAVTLSHVPTWDATEQGWVVEVTADECPATKADQAWTALMTYTDASGNSGRIETMVWVSRYTSEGLCPLPELKNRLGTTGDDSRLLRLAEEVTATIEQFVRVTVPPVTEARNLPLYGLTVYPFELRSVTSVADSSGTALAYTQVPGERSGDHVRWLRLYATPTDRYVVVTGEWGYDKVPADLQRAALDLAAIRYKRETGGGEGPDYTAIGNLADLPPTVRQVVERYVVR